MIEKHLKMVLESSNHYLHGLSVYTKILNEFGSTLGAWRRAENECVDIFNELIPGPTNTTHELVSSTEDYFGGKKNNLKIFL